MTISRKQFDILVYLESHRRAVSQRDVATETGISLGTVNKLLSELTEAGLVADGAITETGIEALEPYRVKRAVFMAAGFGSRLVPITLNTPKPLVRIKARKTSAVIGEIFAEIRSCNAPPFSKSGLQGIARIIACKEIRLVAVFNEDFI